MEALALTSASYTCIYLLLKCVPAVAFLVSTGMAHDTVSVGSSRTPYPVF